jgi:hypothetical protein
MWSGHWPRLHRDQKVGSAARTNRGIARTTISGHAQPSATRPFSFGIDFGIGFAIAAAHGDPWLLAAELRSAARQAAPTNSTFFSLTLESEKPCQTWAEMPLRTPNGKHLAEVSGIGR